MLFKHVRSLLDYRNTLVILVMSIGNRQTACQDFSGLFTGCYCTEAQERPGWWFGCNSICRGAVKSPYFKTRCWICTYELWLGNCMPQDRPLTTYMHAKELGNFRMLWMQQCIPAFHASQIHTFYPNAIRNSWPSWTWTLPLPSKDPTLPGPIKQSLETTWASWRCLLPIPSVYITFPSSWKQHPFLLDALMI